MAKAKSPTPKKTPAQAVAAFDHDHDGQPGGSLPRAARGGTVTVTEKGDGLISDGNGGTYSAGAVIAATPEQAEGLKAAGYAK